MDSLGNTMSITYLNQEDTDQTKWLEYEYKTSWKFKGGGSFETEWITEHTSMINLFIPFKRKQIYLEGDLIKLKEKGIKAISVAINYPFLTL